MAVLTKGGNESSVNVFIFLSFETAVAKSP